MPQELIVELTLLYDGGCPLCLREVKLLSGRDAGRGRISFVDIDDPAYDPASHGGITYREAMGRIHAIRADGTVLRNVAVFREAYRLVGLGWIYVPTGWPLIGPLVEALYAVWAALRLRLTGRPPLDQLCRERESCALRTFESPVNPTASVGSGVQISPNASISANAPISPTAPGQA